MKAIEKLKNELASIKDKTFAEPVIQYLIKRCEEDSGMAEDVCQDHKTWNKCFSYIFRKAREQASGASQCVVKEEVVYEWAEDYYRKDDKELEAKSKETKITKTPIVPEKDKTTKKVKEEPKKVIRDKGEIQGQMSLFDFI